MEDPAEQQVASVQTNLHHITVIRLYGNNGGPKESQTSEGNMRRMRNHDGVSAHARFLFHN